MTIKQIIAHHGGTTAFTNAVNTRLKEIGKTSVSVRTVEGWAQGISEPTAYQVAILEDWMSLKVKMNAIDKKYYRDEIQRLRNESDALSDSLNSLVSCIGSILTEIERCPDDSIVDIANDHLLAKGYRTSFGFGSILISPNTQHEARVD